MNANYFESIIPNVNNVFFSPSFLMRGDKLKYVTPDGDIISKESTLRLYRNLRISNVLEVIKRKTIQFDEPTRWNDPFEKLFYQNVVNCGGRNYYVVCLCFCYDAVQGEESMWNIHSNDTTPSTPDMYVVRGSFDMLNLCKSLAKANSDIEFYVAPVNYSKGRKEILQAKQRRVESGYTAIYEFIGDMLLKRKAFSYEKEIRLFGVSERPFKVNGGFTHIRLNNRNTGFITSLTLPPAPIPLINHNASSYHQDLEKNGNLLKSYLRSNGYKNIIYLSRLYDIMG